MSITREHFSLVRLLRKNVEDVIIGKSEVVRLAIAALLARGHILIEDIPGIGKTALARTLARSIACTFKRIQFTPDLLPGDVTGLSIYDDQKRDFAFKPGPIFANIILADEINRATPRTQSALLEAMNEAHVSVDGTTHPLPAPFFVIATQNPLEFTGTYPLPESQLDRFLMVLRIGYPTPEEEQRIVTSRRIEDPIDTLQAVLTAHELATLSACVRDIRVDPSLTAYLIEIVRRTRIEKSLLAGASPRGSIHLCRAAQAFALTEGRDYVTPDDIKAVAFPVLSHRILERRVRASADGRSTVHQALSRILEETPVPQ